MAKKKLRARKKQNKKKKKPFSLFKFLFKWSFVFALWCGIIGAGVVLYYAKDLPDITDNAVFQRKYAMTVKDKDGNVIARYGEIKGNNIGIGDLPDHLPQAVMAIEDRRFYYHFGLDPIGLARAMLVNARERRFVQGGSTITQQLAKNLFLSRERKIQRKIQEAILAVWLEIQLSKDEILSAYLNRVYLGAGVYGVDAAAKLYFSKSAADLNLQESAILAGLLKAPSRYSPLNNPVLAKQRAKVVLNAMVDAGYVTEEDINSIAITPPRPKTKPSKGEAVRYYSDWVVDGINGLIGTPQTDIVIETTLDKQTQDRAESAITKTLLANGESRNVSEAAMIVMGIDGRVLAMVGGRDYNRSQFNRAAQAKRQPGSSFKPFVYLTAIERGLRPDTLVWDAPFEEGSFRPQNYGNEYHDEVPLQTALALSLNTAAVRLMDYVGRNNVVRTAKRLGIISPIEPELSLALGTHETSMLEMGTAYTAFANGGYRAFPYGITRILGEDGEVLYEREKQLQTQRVIDRRDLSQFNGMMASVVEYGTGAGAQIGVPAAGKTGTTQNSRDAWFIGYTDAVIGVVWMGNDDNTPMKRVTGGSFPARIWAEVMSPTHRKFQHQDSDIFIVSDDSWFGDGGFGGLIEALLNPERNRNGIRWNQTSPAAGSAPRDRWGFNE